MEDAGRTRLLNRGQEEERGVCTHDGAAGDERSPCAFRNVDAITLARVQRPFETIEGPRAEPQPIACGVASLDQRQLRVLRRGIPNVAQYVVRRQDYRSGESREQDDAEDDPQPNRRTPKRTRIALKPSRHVIFFPSA